MAKKAGSKMPMDKKGMYAMMEGKGGKKAPPFAKKSGGKKASKKGC